MLTKSIVIKLPKLVSLGIPSIKLFCKISSFFYHNFRFSTLNEKYDTTTRDPSWICIFCHMHTHVAFLGDLYGPYYIQQVTKF